MKLYKEVDASKELPEQTGMQYPAINKFGAWVLVVYNGKGIWGHEFQEQLSDGYVKYWLKETTLAEIIKERITEGELDSYIDELENKKIISHPFIKSDIPPEAFGKRMEQLKVSKNFLLGIRHGVNWVMDKLTDNE